MSRQPGNFTQAIRYLYSRWYDPSSANVEHDINNATPLEWADSTDTFSISAMTVDADSLVHVASAGQLGARQNENFYFNAAGGLVTQSFFVANRKMVVTGISELHSTAETATGTATAVITHDLPGTVPGTGTVVMTNTFNLKAAANTLQTATLLAVTGLGAPNAGIILAPGDRLTLVVGGTATITALAGVTLTVNSRPGFKEVYATYNMQANASIATEGFFLANRDFVVSSVWMTWSAAGTNAGTVTMDLTLETSTTAPGGGTTILAAAQSVKGTANTPVLVPLSATAANLILRAGTRLSLKTNGTLTALAGLVVTVSLVAIGGTNYVGQEDVTYHLKANGSLATEGFWIADRDYEVVDFSAVEAVAGTDGGAVTLDCTIDKGVVAPGAGASCLAATVSLKTTANTVVYPGVNTARHLRMISQGDLISVKYTGTLTTLSGVLATLSVLPR